MTHFIGTVYILRCRRQNYSSIKFTLSDRIVYICQLKKLAPLKSQSLSFLIDSLIQPRVPARNPQLLQFSDMNQTMRPLSLSVRPRNNHLSRCKAPVIPRSLNLAMRQHSTSTHLAQKSSWTHPMLVHSIAVIIQHSNSWIICRYTKKQILDVQTAHRKAASWQDRVALSTVKVLRWGMDFVTGYGSYSPLSISVPKTRTMTEQRWLTRFIFLESVAGVPGMVAGMLRHLKSIRMMRRDHGW